MKRIQGRLLAVLFGVVLGVFSGAAVSVSNEVEWADGFENYAVNTPLIDGIGGWYASDPECVVQNIIRSPWDPPGSTNAAAIPIDVTLSNRFQNTASVTSLWIRVDVRPVHYDGDENPAVDTNATVMFYINTNGLYVTHDKDSWVTNTVSPVSGAPAVSNSATDFVRIHLYKNYTTKKWDLFSNYQLVTNDLSFISSNNLSLSGFDIYNGGGATTFLDNVYVITNLPADLGADGGDWLPSWTKNVTSIERTVFEGNVAADQQFQVERTNGYYTLSYTTTTNAGWLSLDPGFGSSAAAPAGDTAKIDTTGLTAQLAAREAIIEIIGTDARYGFSAGTQTVAAILNVMGMDVNKADGITNNTAVYGSNANQDTFTVRNSGAGTFSYTITTNIISPAGTHWIESVSPNSGSAAGGDPANTHTITYNTAGISAGSHTGEVVIASSDGGGATSVVTIVMNITQKPLTVTATGPTKIYGTALTAGASTENFTAVGAVAGETVTSVTLTPDAAGELATTAAGLGYVVTPSAATGIGGFNTANYAVTYNVYNGTVAQKELTVTGAQADNKVYDGNTDATISGATLQGKVGADDVELDALVGAFAQAAVGNDIAVTAALTLKGGAKNNYTLTQPTGLKANITKTALTLTANSFSKQEGTLYEFNGTEFAITAGELLGSDEITSATLGSGGAPAGAAAGEYDITISDAGGTGVGNYTITYVKGKLDVTAKIVLELSDGLVVADKAYDGTTAATVTSWGVLVGIEEGDVVTLNTNGHTANFNTKNIGTNKLVTVSGLALAGADANKYTIGNQTTRADITPKALTVTGITADNKAYNGNAVATLNVSGHALVGVVGGETVTLDAADYTATFNNKDVDNDKPVTVSGLELDGVDAGNYTLTQPTGLTANITKAPLELTADSFYKVHGVTYTFTGAEFSITAGALYGADAVTAVTLSSLGADVAANLGAYDIEISAATGAGLDNYNITYVKGTLTVTDKTILTLPDLVVAEKVYDGGTAATVSNWGDLKDGVNPPVGDVALDHSGHTAAFDSKNAGNNRPATVRGLALTGAQAVNYVINNQTTTANVTPKQITVTGINADNKAYDGGTVATLTSDEYTLTGIIDPDDVTLDPGVYTATFNNKNVGTNKAVTVIGLGLAGDDGGNYELEQPAGLTADITRKSLTVSGISADNKAYDGGVTATLTTTGYTLAGVVGSETVTLDASAYTANFNTHNVGKDKPVAVSGLALVGLDAGSYTLAQPTDLRADITRKSLTVSGISANDKIYDGETTATLTTDDYELAGIVDGETVTLNASAYIADFDSKNIGTDKPVTVSGLALAGLDSGNYALTQPTDLLADVTAIEVTIGGTFTAEDKIYDGAKTAVIKDNNLTLTGLVQGDTVTLDPSAEFADADVGDNKTVTLTGDTALGGADAANYELSLAGAPATTASILQAGETILAVEPVSLSTTGAEGADALPLWFEIWNAAESGDPMNYIINANVVWINVSPASGSSSGERDRITVDFSTASLAAGDHSGAITVTAGAQSKVIPVSLSVIAYTPADALNVETERIAVQTRRDINAKSQTFEVWNSGVNKLGYNITKDADWMSVSPVSGSSSGERNTIEVSFDTVGMIRGRYTGTITVTASNGETKEIEVFLGIGAAPYDFDGDSKSDPWYYHAETGMWYYRLSSTLKLHRLQFGFPGTVPVPGDYDGDGQTDHAVYHAAAGLWYILTSQGEFSVIPFGFPGTVPVPGDYDGDGLTDLAIYHPVDGMWYVLTSGGDYWALQFGFPGAVPVPADYSGDFKTDIAVYYPPSGMWYIWTWIGDYWEIQFGWNETQPVPGDYNASGKSDIAVYHPPSGMWYTLTWEGVFSAEQFGFEAAAPLPADYDGDGITDKGVFHKYLYDATWYLMRSSQGFESVSARDSRPE